MMTSYQAQWRTGVGRLTQRSCLVCMCLCRFFFVASSSSVKIFSTTTGRLVSTLSSILTTASTSSGNAPATRAGHSAPITGMALNPANVLQLITSSLDGTIKVWDFLDGILVRTINVGYPITHMLAHESMKGRICVVLRKPRHANTVSPNAQAATSLVDAGLSNSIVQIFSLAAAAGKSAPKNTKSTGDTRVGKSRHASGMAMSPDGRYLVVVGRRKIHVADMNEPSRGFAKFLTDHNLTCVAFHPSENTFATGDEIGQIRLWYFLGDNSTRLAPNSEQQTAPSTLLHWHAHAVSALTFTPNGAYLASGGEESVLVLWQLANLSREYVPRLGGATIASISILAARQGGRQEQYVAALSDGSVAFVGAVNLKPLRTIAGVLALLGNEGVTSSSRLPLAVQPNTGHLVIAAGHPSSLQFVDPDSDEQVMQLEVVPSNRVSRPDDAPLAAARVEHVCFSRDASWMATLDRKPTGEVTLKIWQWEERRRTYLLNTRIDDPHGPGATVHSIDFSPRAFASLAGSPLLVTTGSDKRSKTWRCILRDGKRLGQKDVFWVARSSFDYRDTIPTCSAWSPDASLLAIAQGTCVTLWEPQTNALLHVVPVPTVASEAPLQPIDAVTALAFVGKGGRYLAAASAGALSVWDIVRGHFMYETRERNAFAILDGVHGRFFVLSKPPQATTHVATYLPTVPHRLGEESLPFSVMQVASSTGRREAEGSTATQMSFAITGECDVVRFGEEAETATSKSEGSTAQSLRGVTVKRRTLYDELFGPRDQNVDLAQGHTSAAATAGTAKATPCASAASLFNMSSHLLPPVQTLFEPFMQRILPRRQEDDSKVAGSNGPGAQTSGQAGEATDEGTQGPDSSMARAQTPHAASARSIADGLDVDSIAGIFAQLATEHNSQGDAATSNTPNTQKTTDASKAVGGDAQANGSHGKDKDGKSLKKRASLLSASAGSPPKGAGAGDHVHGGRRTSNAHTHTQNGTLPAAGGRKRRKSSTSMEH